MSEYGKRCGSCKQITPQDHPARIFFHQVKGIKRKDKNDLKWRKLCTDCWNLALEKER